MSTVLDPGFHMIHYDALLHNVTDIITKCDSFIAKYKSYYKLQWFYYKMLQLLQNAMSITNCDSTLWNKLTNGP